MRTTNRFLAVSLLVSLAALVGLPDRGSASPDDGGRLDTFSSSFFQADDPCAVKDFPTFESIAPVPDVLDPFQDDPIPLFCDFFVRNGSKSVKGAKVKYQVDILVRDNATGETETFRAMDGSLRTDRNGRGGFDFDLPAEIFADGFESGDVSAWSYTRANFTNKKMADRGSLTCTTGSEGSPRAQGN